MIQHNIMALLACILLAIGTFGNIKFSDGSLELVRNSGDEFERERCAGFPFMYLISDIISPKLAQVFHLSPAYETIFGGAFNTTIDCGTNKTATTHETSANSTSAPSEIEETEISFASFSNFAPSTNLNLTKARESYTTASVLEPEDEMVEDIYR